MSSYLKDAQSETFTVQAGDRLTYPATGRFVYCFESDGELELSMNNGAKIYLEGGVGRVIPEDMPDFTSFQLYNKTGGTITCSISWGFGDVIDRRFTTSGVVETSGLKATALKSSEKVTVTDAAAAASILAANSSRKCVFLRNISPAYTVYIGDANVSMTNGRGFPLAAGEAIPLGSANEPFTGEIYAHADGGANVDITILEME